MQQLEQNFSQKNFWKTKKEFLLCFIYYFNLIANTLILVDSRRTMRCKKVAYNYMETRGWWFHSRAWLSNEIWRNWSCIFRSWQYIHTRLYRSVWRVSEQFVTKKNIRKQIIVKKSIFCNSFVLELKFFNLKFKPKQILNKFNCTI